MDSREKEEQFRILTDYDRERLPHMPVSDDVVLDTVELSHSLSKDLTCPICLELLDEAMVTKCLHRFCGSCIKMNLRKGNFECPTCRKKIVSHRDLRSDPNIDEIIRKIWPNGLPKDEENDKEAMDISLKVGKSIEEAKLAQENACKQQTRCTLPRRRSLYTPTGRKRNCNVNGKGQSTSLGPSICPTSVISESVESSSSSSSSSSESSSSSSMSSSSSDVSKTPSNEHGDDLIIASTMEESALVLVNASAAPVEMPTCSVLSNEQDMMDSDSMFSSSDSELELILTGDEEEGILVSNGNEQVDSTFSTSNDESPTIAPFKSPPRSGFAVCEQDFDSPEPPLKVPTCKVSVPCPGISNLCHRSTSTSLLGNPLRSENLPVSDFGDSMEVFRTMRDYIGPNVRVELRPWGNSKCWWGPFGETHLFTLPLHAEDGSPTKVSCLDEYMAAKGGQDMSYLPSITYFIKSFRQVGVPLFAGDSIYTALGIQLDGRRGCTGPVLIHYTTDFK